ncbi:MAG TPA: hypothetical protein VEL74_05335 [Thermoanaerobaculia bacterium]|nr:hypothetical protein [Thermoanaerobaculia bacterium]
MGDPFLTLAERQQTVDPGLLEEALALLAERGPEALARGPERLRGPVAFEAFLRHSWAVLHADPAQAIESARWATRFGSRLDPEELGARGLADLRCRAWAILGNAYRVADNLSAAEFAFTEAFNHFAAGSRDRSLQARLLDFQASFRADQRRFPEAIALLDRVFAIFQERGDEHLAGRALLSKGLFTGYSGDPEGAIRLIEEGLSRIDSGRDPNLALWATHNLSLFMIETGRFEEARALAHRNLRRFAEREHRIDFLKLRWIEARADAGLGLLDEAEEAFVEVREGMLDVGKRYHSALAALDLAVIHRRQGRPEEACSTILEAAEMFLEIEISREAIAAVLALQDSCRAGLETGGLLEKVMDFLRHLERDPTLRFKDWAGQPC